MASGKRPSRSPKRDEVRLWGAPEPANFKKSETGRALSEAARIHLKKQKEIDKLLVLEKLAIDIFLDSESARAFAANPKEYMARAGFRNVKIDLNSYEVRLAMAMGDPLVRRAAAEGDTREFVRAVMAQGLGDLSVGSLGGVFVAELIVHASAIATAVAVAVTKAVVLAKAAVVVEVKVTGDGGTILTREIEILSRMAESFGNPSLVRQIQSPEIREMLAKYIELQG
jgi:hypothetical protein